MSKQKNKKSGRGKGKSTSSVARKGGSGVKPGLPPNNGNDDSRDTVPHAIQEGAFQVEESSQSNGYGEVVLASAVPSLAGTAAQQAATSSVLVIEELDETGSAENGHSNGHSETEEAVSARVAAPAPVKARVGQPLDSRPFTGNGNGHGTGIFVSTNDDGTYDGAYDGNGYGGNGNGNGHTTGSLRRSRLSLGRDTVVVAPGTVHPTTGHLRQTDLLKARVRGNGSVSAATMPLFLPQPQRPPARLHSRELPYFLMRHRNIRGRSRVGHTRSVSATRRFGSNSPFKAIVIVFLVLTLLAGTLVAGGMGAGIGGTLMYLNSLPSIDPKPLSDAIALNGINVQTTTFYDRNGTPIYEVVDDQWGRREEIPLDKMSQLIIDATLAAEDVEFYSNPGVDIKGIVRAVNINLSGQGTSGASTITQQLARLLLMSPEERAKSSGWDGFNRKLKEMVLAVQLTRKYSKNFILETYLNQIPYGHRAYGIAAAAYTYFGIEAKDLKDKLTLPQAAMLAGLPQAPSYYDPFLNYDVAKARQHIVLDLMTKNGMITQEEAEAAKQVDLRKGAAQGLREPRQILHAPHFVYYVKDYIERTRGSDFLDRGYKIYTTLDLGVQDTAQQIAKDRVEEIRRQRASNAAIVIMKPGTGEILAMVGSVDYNDETIDGQVNVAVAERQPGSSFKPITFATAFTKGWSPGTTILDVWTGFPGGAGQKQYTPKNYDGRDHGWVTVREALGNSYNVPAVKGLQFAGIQDTLDMAHNMGIEGLQKGLDYYGLALTLGGGEVTLLDMTTAYSTFANNGWTVGANPILKVVDSEGRIVEAIPGVAEVWPGEVVPLQPDLKEGEVIPGEVAPKAQAMDPRIAYMITSILSDNRARTPAFGANSALRTSFPSAAKTGTTDNNRDSWTLGYTPNLAVGVWVGNSDNSEMNRVTGAIGAAVIWNKVMEDFHSNPDYMNLLRKEGPDGELSKLQMEFVEPDGLIRASACNAEGGVTDLFLRESRPKGCVTYKDPKGNVQLHSLPSERPRQTQPRATPRPQPPAPPTPIPGIFPPGWAPDQQP
jgi:membrane peptidoglycan carboxypeptidase